MVVGGVVGSVGVGCAGLFGSVGTDGAGVGCVGLFGSFGVGWVGGFAGDVVTVYVSVVASSQASGEPVMVGVSTQAVFLCLPSTNFAYLAVNENVCD